MNSARVTLPESVSLDEAYSVWYAMEVTGTWRYDGMTV